MSPNRFAEIKDMLRRRPLIVSLAAGLMAMLLMVSYLKRREAELLYIADPLPVVVAAADIPAGVRIDDSMLSMVRIPRRYVQPAAFRTTAEACGMIAAVPFEVGSQIVRHAVVTIGSESGVAVAVPRGMRAVTVAVDDVGGLAGLVRPGDRVDVLATFDFGDEAVSRRSTAVVLQAAAVLAVGDQMAAVSPRAPAAAERAGVFGGLRLPQPTRGSNATVTLAAYPRDAQALVFAQESGMLGLVVRAKGDDEVQTQAPVTIETLTGLGGLIRQRKPAYREYRGR